MKRTVGSVVAVLAAAAALLLPASSFAYVGNPGVSDSSGSSLPDIPRVDPEGMGGNGVLLLRSDWFMCMY